MRRRTPIAAAVLAAVAFAIPTAMAVEVVSNVGDRPVRAKPHKLVCTPAGKPAGFRLYSLGMRFERLPLTAVLRSCGNPMPVPGDNPKLPPTYRLNSVSYIYGDCEPPEGEGGCATPLEIQISPACETNVSLYEHRPKITRRRGVPSSGSDGKLELYTGDSTVSIFTGNDASRLGKRAVKALQPIRRGDPPAKLPPRLGKAERLPAPVAGAMSGDLRCDRR